jgi:hypothetical protein
VGDMFGRLLHCLALVLFGSDVVAIENASRQVPADRHGDTFADASADHIPDTRSAQIMKETLRFDLLDNRLALLRCLFVKHDLPMEVFLVNDVTGKACLIARSGPRFPKFFNALTVAMEGVLRQRRAARCRILPCGPASLDDLRELALEDELMRTTILDVPGARNDDAGAAIDIGPRQFRDLSLAPGAEIGQPCEVVGGIWVYTVWPLIHGMILNSHRAAWANPPSKRSQTVDECNS